MNSRLGTISVIVPTLNEEEDLDNLLSTLADQTFPPLEVIIVDGGSEDVTLSIAERAGARAIVAPGCAEFPSRNVGAALARGSILFFTGADVLLPKTTLESISMRFTSKPQLLAVSGPGVPYGAPLLLGIEYAVYNLLRFLLAQLPKPLRRFSSSTNLLAVRKEVFERLGPFEDDINADGRFGRKLCEEGETDFAYFGIRALISPRRLESMGFWAFNRHFLYVIENVSAVASRWAFVRSSKAESARAHQRMRVGTGSQMPSVVSDLERARARRDHHMHDKPNADTAENK